MSCSQPIANSRTRSLFCRNCTVPLVRCSSSAVGGGAAAAVLPLVVMEEEGTGMCAGVRLCFLAALMDGAIFLGATLWLFLRVVRFTRGNLQSSGTALVQTISELVLISRIVRAIILWLYCALMESSSWQATVGKRMADIYITDLHRRRLRLARDSGRDFARFISNLSVLVGCLIAGFSEKQPALHGMIASCLVQRRTQAEPALAPVFPGVA